MSVRPLTRLATLLLAVSTLAGAQAPPAALKLSMLDLEIRGGFQERGDAGFKFLSANGVGISVPAAGAIDIPQAGKYHLWVQSRSLTTDSPGMRNFSLRLGSQTIAKTFGNHHQTTVLEFHWEDGGTIELPSGPLLVVLGEAARSWAQCSNILLTEDLTASSPEQLFSHAKAAKIVPLAHDDFAAVRELPAVKLDPKPALATLSNQKLRISFLTGSMTEGSATQPAVVQQIQVKSGDVWKLVPTTGGGDSYRIVYRPASSDPHLVEVGVQFATWDTSLAPEVTYSAGGASIHGHEGPLTAPWLGGYLSQLRPTSAHQVNPTTVELDFPPQAIGTLTARWHLLPDQPSASVELDFALTKPGYVSLGYHGAVEEMPAKLDFLMLPYLYLGHRFPSDSVFVPSDRTPTPAAMVTRSSISYAVMAEPGVIPFAWPGPSQVRYGLGIRNESGKAEPMIYQPLLGSPESLHKQPEAITAKFRIWAEAASWIDSYRDMITEGFGVKDYRHPVNASLSSTVLNLAALMKNNDASGWDPRAKGSWNIESRNVVTQPSPITYMSYALLTGDESFYRNYALPSIEFLLSRPEAHFTAAGGSDNSYTNSKRSLGDPNVAYTCAVFAGAYELMQGGAPALANFCFKPDGRIASHPSHYAEFDDDLALFHATGDHAWLDKATESADKYIAANLTELPSLDLGPEPFVNQSFTPDWEGLLHMYEATHEQRFLNASRGAAYWLMTSIWTQPSIPTGDTTVHPGNIWNEPSHIWWKGDHQFRLGFMDKYAPLNTHNPDFPSIAVPQATVPSWQISNVGLGIEQPVTYAQPTNDNNIMMSIWAPNFLRLGGFTGDPLYRTVARNATIGRFTNYPGYYLHGFTNLVQKLDYIYKGPDLSSFYYHHIAPFAAYVVDYVFTDAEVRSKGEFIFPSVRQFGYVWFDSRLRGFAPGKVYGETAWPWIHPTAASTDNINVDVVLAHSKTTLYTALMNQTSQPQHLKLHFDATVLGGSLSNKHLREWWDNQPSAPQTLHDDTLELDLPANGFTVLALDGLNIHVAAHEFTPPNHYDIHPNDAMQIEPIAGSTLKASGTIVASPAFHQRELYAFVDANIHECSGAKLTYTIANGSEQHAEVKQFPCEFSVPVPYDAVEIHWHIDSVITPKQ